MEKFDIEKENMKHFNLYERFLKIFKCGVWKSPQMQNLVSIESKGIIGAIIGDVVGSRFEFCENKTTEFALFDNCCEFTDDTVMTIAVADWLLGRDLVESMRDWGRRCPDRGYGGMFNRWLFSKEIQSPYNSFGNGSGMRVSPAGFYAHSLDEALDLAKKSAEVTHNHPEGIKGAQAIASAIYLARTGKDKDEIRNYIEQMFGYDLHRNCDDIRPNYIFNETCQCSCPEAIIAFLDSENYESAIRLAVSLGGDSDTIACMTGGIAAAFYGVPDAIIEQVIKYLPYDMLEVIRKFDKITYNQPCPDLQHFIDAQEHNYATALAEVKMGLKTSHWIWYIFPQLRGLGKSHNSEYYGIRDLNEARKYLCHPVLGSRLREITEALLAIEGKSANQILGGIDTMKVQSSMTLFDTVCPNDIFCRVIDKYYAGVKDSRTLKMLNPTSDRTRGNSKMKPEYTPEFIEELQQNEIFVFGSNLDGFHGGGAARVAMRKFGAEWGQGIGLHGQSYAIPTMQGGVETIKPYVDEFIAFARIHPELTFYVTRIGCGIAGFTDNEIAPLFREAIAVENIILPKSFVVYNG